MSKLFEAFELLAPTAVRASCFAVLYAAAIEAPLVFNVYLAKQTKVVNNIPTQVGQTGAQAGIDPYTVAGLDGTGQVAGTCDTGVDLNSCYFSQASGPQVGY